MGIREEQKSIILGEADVMVEVKETNNKQACARQEKNNLVELLWMADRRSLILYSVFECDELLNLYCYLVTITICLIW